MANMSQRCCLVGSRIKKNQLLTTVPRPDIYVQTRALSNGQLQEVLTTNSSQRSFINDATHIWNKAPANIKLCVTLSSAKMAINTIVLTLPI